jgi:hypothetical protein
MMPPINPGKKAACPANVSIQPISLRIKILTSDHKHIPAIAQMIV